MQLNINLRNIDKYNLAISEYLLLNILYENPDICLRYQDLEILNNLEKREYVRIINDSVILEPKARKLFENEVVKQAKEVLDYLNDLKKKYYPNSKGFSYRVYGNEINARLQEGVSVEDTKRMLNYIFKERTGGEYEKYLTPTTLFNKKKFHNYIFQMESNQDKVEIKQSKMA